MFTFIASQHHTKYALSAPNTQALCHMDIIPQQRSEAERKARRTLYGLKDPLFTLNIYLFQWVIPMTLNQYVAMATNTGVHQLSVYTLLLGPYKYLTEALMEHLSVQQKVEIQAKIIAYDFSCESHLSTSLCHHHKSFQITKSWHRWPRLYFGTYYRVQNGPCGQSFLML